MKRGKKQKKQQPGPNPFRINDVIVLVNPFECRGDGSELDEALDRELRAAAIPEGSNPEGVVVGIESEDVVEVQFYNYYRPLFVSNGVLEIAEPDPDEVEAAIRSIKGLL